MVNKDFGINYKMGSLRAKKKSVKKRWIWLLLLLLLVAIPLLFSKLPKSLDRQKIITNKVSPSPSQDFNYSKNSKNLENIVKGSLASAKGTYAVGIINLKTGEEFFSNANLQFDAASLYKLWVMAVVYQKIESNSLHLTDILSEDVQILNKKFNIDEKLAEQKEGKVEYSVADALSLMISKSDNYASLLLAEKVRLSSVQKFLTDSGFTNSRVGINGNSPTTTVRDISDFFYKLQNGEFANSKNTDEMITILRRQVLNEKIPKNLPINTIVAHKTGELDDFNHDGGIVFAPNANYIIVVLSKTNSRVDANETIANLSKAVYDYFSL